MKGIVLKYDISGCCFIENWTEYNYKIDFNSNGKLIYTCFVGAFINITIPNEVNKFTPSITITKLIS